MNAVSPLIAVAEDLFSQPNRTTPLWSEQIDGIRFEICNAEGYLWVLTDLYGKTKLTFIPVQAWAGGLKLVRRRSGNKSVQLILESAAGRYEFKLSLLGGSRLMLRYTTQFTPYDNMFIPAGTRDIMMLAKKGHAGYTAGRIHTAQRGGRSGLIYFSVTRPKAGTLMYFQNLTAIAGYCQQTETSCMDTVGGNWPELGFALPVSDTRPLKAGIAVTLNDALIQFDRAVPTSEKAMVRQYLELLADIYQVLPKPEPVYRDWPRVMKKGLKDLTHPGCLRHINSHLYFNAYLSDYQTPPEIMVQLAILLPLVDYTSWSGQQVEIAEDIKAAIPNFVDPQLKVIKRWLPAVEQLLDGEEEQKIPGVMDAWYLHHPLLNLSRLALGGDKDAKRIFIDSLEYTIKVARHFNYEWPIFYKMDTLEVVKKEAGPGEGGERDVPGLYATVMMQAYYLTGENRYLLEAKRAAEKLAGKGFELFYQANNTAFTACTLLRLAKLSGESKYQELSYLCMAAMFDNVHLWDCNYGHGRAFGSFFALYPLKDAPYTAAYEESEVLCAFHEYLRLSSGMNLIRPLKILVTEFVKYMTDRGVFYYPPMLPEEALDENVKTGEINRKLWVVLEDLHDGWEANGGVGQEVYGAGNAFGITPRHYIRVTGEPFLVFCEYPFTRVKHGRSRVSFTVMGDKSMKCRIRVVSIPRKRKVSLRLTMEKDNLEPTGRIPEWTVFGESKVTLSWK